MRIVPLALARGQDLDIDGVCAGWGGAEGYVKGESLRRPLALFHSAPRRNLDGRTYRVGKYKKDGFLMISLPASRRREMPLANLTVTCTCQHGESGQQQPRTSLPHDLLTSRAFLGVSPAEFRHRISEIPRSAHPPTHTSSSNHHQKSSSEVTSHIESDVRDTLRIQYLDSKLAPARCHGVPCHGAPP